MSHPAPSAGESFVDFVLGDFDSATARAESPLAMIVWHTGCPTSRLAIAYWQRLADAHPGVRLVGICQDNQSKISSYCAQNDIRFPQLSDSALEVSRAYGVSTVPACWVTDASGVVVDSWVSWDLERFNDLNARLANLAGSTPNSLFEPHENVSVFKPG